MVLRVACPLSAQLRTYTNGAQYSRLRPNPEVEGFSAMAENGPMIYLWHPNRVFDRHRRAEATIDRSAISIMFTLVAEETNPFRRWQGLSTIGSVLWLSGKCQKTYLQ